MAHRLGLREPRQADIAFAGEPAQTRGEIFRFVEIDAGGLVAPGFEDQRLFLQEGAVAGEGSGIGGDRAVAGRRWGVPGGSA